MFLVSKEAEMVPKAPQKAPKTLPKGAQSAVENRLDEKIPPGPSQRQILECFGVRVGAFFCTFRGFSCNFFCSRVVVAIYFFYLIFLVPP
jgi:hypothetical protein